MIDAAHGLHPLRRQADFVPGDPVGAYDFSEIDLLDLIGRRKIGKIFKPMKILSLAMLRRDQFSGRYDSCGGHMVFSQVEWSSGSSGELT